MTDSKRRLGDPVPVPIELATRHNLIDLGVLNATDVDHPASISTAIRRLSDYLLVAAPDENWKTQGGQSNSERPQSSTLEDELPLNDELAGWSGRLLAGDDEDLTELFAHPFFCQQWALFNQTFCSDEFEKYEQLAKIPSPNFRFRYDIASAYSYAIIVNCALPTGRIADARKEFLSVERLAQQAATHLEALDRCLRNLSDWVGSGLSHHLRLAGVGTDIASISAEAAALAARLRPLGAIATGNANHLSGADKGGMTAPLLPFQSLVLFLADAFERATGEKPGLKKGFVELVEALNAKITALNTPWRSRGVPPFRGPQSKTARRQFIARLSGGNKPAEPTA